jgi:hypothetical protein
MVNGKWQNQEPRTNNQTKNQKPRTKNQKSQIMPHLLEPATALLIMIANASSKNPAGFAMGSRPGLSDFHALR